MAAPASKTIGDLNGRWVMVSITQNYHLAYLCTTRIQPSPPSFFVTPKKDLQAPSHIPDATSN